LRGAPTSPCPSWAATPPTSRWWRWRWRGGDKPRTARNMCE
jgi:hypothetical protein